MFERERKVSREELEAVRVGVGSGLELDSTVLDELEAAHEALHQPLKLSDKDKAAREKRALREANKALKGRP